MDVYGQLQGLANGHFWDLNPSDLFSIFGFVISAAALFISVLIYVELKKGERKHVASALSVVYDILANRKRQIETFILLARDRNGPNTPDLEELGRFIVDNHPFMSRDADRMDLALDPIRLLLPAELNKRLIAMTEYFRTFLDLELDDPELTIIDAARAWFNRQIALPSELHMLMTEIRREVPEIPPPQRLLED